MRQPRLLVADDQPDVIEALRLLLKAEGYEIETASSPRAVVEAVQAREFDLMLMDLNYARDTTSGDEGLELVAHVRAIDPHLPVVVMTAWSTVTLAVATMREGAGDFVQKPWDNARLITTLRTQIELGRALRRSRRLEQENSRLRGSTPQMIAQSSAMQAVLRVLERVAPSEANVLISGEQRGVHRDEGRRQRPLPEQVLQNVGDPERRVECVCGVGLETEKMREEREAHEAGDRADKDA